MKKALFVMNWIAVCGLCVAATLFVPKHPFRTTVLESLVLEDISWRRPEVLPNFARFELNEEGNPEPRSIESMQKLGTEWAKYAMQIETQHEFSKNLLRQRAIQARRITILFWVALTLLLLNVCASFRAFFTPRSSEETAKNSSAENG